MKRFLSSRWQGFGGTVIGEVARLAQSRGAVDLALGSPEIAPPEALLRAAAEAVLAGANQYTSAWGDESLRLAIAAKVERDRGLRFDPASEITVTCGATEGMTDVLLAVADPGDEVVLFEPYYENYLQIALALGMAPRFVRLHRPGWTFDEAELAAAFSPRTKVVVLNSPNNPTGKVLDRDELEVIAGLCQRWDALCLSDEVYEHLVFDGGAHVSIAEVPGMRERTAVVNSLSKTYSVTGWRIGYILAPPDLTAAVRNVHDVATYCAPAPLQAAALTALALPGEYYRGLCATLESHRDQLRACLEGSGFRCHPVQGGYFLMTDLGRWGFAADRDLVGHLISEVGVAAVPGSAFYSRPEAGEDLLRFCFGKSAATLAVARERFARAAAGHGPVDARGRRL